MDGINVMASGDFIEFFEELLYGSGAWIGLLLILGLVLVVTLKVKYSSALFVPFMIFMGLFYMDNVAENVDFIYSVFMSWATVPILLIMEYKRQ